MSFTGQILTCRGEWHLEMDADRQVGAICGIHRFLRAPDDEELQADARKHRARWEFVHFPVRRRRPWVRLSAGEAGRVRVERLFVENDRFYYFLRMPSGRLLRVWPWRTFRCEDEHDAEYMRLKVIALAEGADVPPLDYDYEHFDLEKYRRDYEAWWASKDRPDD